MRVVGRRVRACACVRARVFVTLPALTLMLWADKATEKFYLDVQRGAVLIHGERFVKRKREKTREQGMRACARVRVCVCTRVCVRARSCERLCCEPPCCRPSTLHLLVCCVCRGAALASGSLAARFGAQRAPEPTEELDEAAEMRRDVKVRSHPVGVFG